MKTFKIKNVDCKGDGIVYLFNTNENRLDKIKEQAKNILYKKEKEHIKYLEYTPSDMLNFINCTIGCGDRLYHTSRIKVYEVDSKTHEKIKRGVNFYIEVNDKLVVY
jgi:hypothetical protein